MTLSGNGAPAGGNLFQAVSVGAAVGGLVEQITVSQPPGGGAA